MVKTRYRLEVVKGFEEGLVFPLEGEKVAIGRGEDNDLMIPVAEVSRQHAVLIKDEKGYMIKDLGSTNGTFIDRKKIGGKYLLSSGDTIMLGDAVHLVFKEKREMDDTLASTPPAPMKVPQPEAREAQPAPPTTLEEREPAPPPEPSEGIPVAADPEELQGKEERKTWLWAGIGCLAVIFFFGMLGLILFDYLNLYCTPPFDTLFDFLYTCP